MIAILTAAAVSGIPVEQGRNFLSRSVTVSYTYSHIAKLALPSAADQDEGWADFHQRPCRTTDF